MEGAQCEKELGNVQSGLGQQLGNSSQPLTSFQAVVGVGEFAASEAEGDREMSV